MEEPAVNALALIPCTLLWFWVGVPVVRRVEKLHPGRWDPSAVIMATFMWPILVPYCFDGEGAKERHPIQWIARKIIPGVKFR